MMMSVVDWWWLSVSEDVGDVGKEAKVRK